MYTEWFEYTSFCRPSSVNTHYILKTIIGSQQGCMSALCMLYAASPVIAYGCHLRAVPSHTATLNRINEMEKEMILLQ